MMGMAIFATDEAQPAPREVTIELRCDWSEDLFHCESWWRSTDGYIAARARAGEVGWSITSERALCPLHSGKKR